MKLPKRNRHWRADVLSAFDQAAKLYESGKSGLDSFLELYKLAALIAAERRGIKEVSTIQGMAEFSQEGVEFDHQLEPKNKNKVLFHFVIAYIQSHVPAGLLNEKEADDVMEYLNENIDLFIAV